MEFKTKPLFPFLLLISLPRLSFGLYYLQHKAKSETLKRNKTASVPPTCRPGLSLLQALRLRSRAAILPSQRCLCHLHLLPVLNETAYPQLLLPMRV